ncbi:hypothetical protein [Methylotenera sp. L2L1]|uniref:hypothetical protein n=1 Tax=Methylotenera sp. L2L1 TaxID=1502770 RepID=UPI0005630609|nr:hypothetical protein [Methylotenera sp. L2L1]
MDTFLKPEILIPIALNFILAITTVFYLLETRTSRKAIVNQFEIAQRQHFVSTTPFIYAGTLKRVDDSEDLSLSLVNPGDKLARDVSCILYEHEKKTFRYPKTTKVVIKPNESSSITINTSPYTANEVISRLEKFYDTNTGIDSHLVTTPKTSYILLMFTDIEGSVYSVKAFFTWDEEDKFSRQRSKFQKLNDPRNS